MRLAGVFEHRDIVARGGRQDGIEIADAAAEVHRNDGPSLRRDRRFELTRVQLERLGIRIDKDRDRILPQHRVNGRDERVRRHDDFIAGFNPHGIETGKQRARAVGGGQARLGPGQLRVSLLETSDVLAVAAVPFAAAQRVEDRALFGLVANRPGGKRRGVRFGATENSGAVARGARGQGRAGQRGGG